MLGLSANLTQTVFVYLCSCICVFACHALGNIVFEVLLPLPFQKNSTEPAMLNPNPSHKYDWIRIMQGR